MFIMDTAYKKIKSMVTENKTPDLEHQAAIILGGQPGAGKTSIFRDNPEFSNYVLINADDFRIFHPDYDAISKKDYEHYAERTQGFINTITERLIEELSNEGYNLLIEGTLRTVAVPLRTCKALKNKGYNIDLYVVAEDATISWENTIKRAEAEFSQNKTPRLVPVDKYKQIISVLSDNLEQLCSNSEFRTIQIATKEGRTFVDKTNARKTLDTILKKEQWESEFEKHADEYLNKQKEFLSHAVEITEFER